MRRLVCDVECSISNKGNPFDTTNTLVVVGILDVDTKQEYLFYYPEEVEQIQEILKDSLFIAHNAKFDLHWIRRIGIDTSSIKVWCTQLAEFIISNQLTKFPSLDGAAEKYGLDKKLDVVKLDFWEKGFDTPEIPRDILSDYLLQDLKLTGQVYLKQKELFEGVEGSKRALFNLHCQDLIVLEEMEYNGILFDVENAMKMATELEREQDEIHTKLTELIGNIPFNLNSGDHLSAIFYGGTIVIEDRIPVGVYKTGEKTGQPRYKVVEKAYELPRLVAPLEKTECKKPIGSPPVWYTNEDVLRSLKHTKESKALMTLISKYSGLEKLRGTYLVGWSKMIEKMNWEPNMIHGQLNQCIVVTGRLSSSKPNLQNADPRTKTFCISSYTT